MPKAAKPTQNNNWWCFTLNNYTEDEYETIRALYHDRKYKISYIVVGREKGDEGTPHLQGFIAFAVRKKFATVKAIVGDRAHLEPMRSIPAKAAAYCKKEGDFFEKGALPTEAKAQGSRSDLNAVKDALDAGGSTWDLAKESYAGFATISRSHKFFIGYETALAAPRDFQTQVYVLYGDPGTYKSYAAHLFADLFTVVRPRHSGDGVWFDGYDPARHRAALLDDFYGWMPFNNLLELCDRYGSRVQVKGGTVQWKPQVLAITSNVAPDRWYKYGEGMDFNALKRRLAHVFEHRRVEAGNDALGVGVGDLVVTAHLGSIDCHPLREHMLILPNGQGKLLDIQAELATQMDADMQIEFTRAAMNGAPTRGEPEVVEILSSPEPEDANSSISYADFFADNQ